MLQKDSSLNINIGSVNDCTTKGLSSGDKHLFCQIAVDRVWKNRYLNGLAISAIIKAFTMAE